MENRTLKEKIAAGRRVYGTLVTVTNPKWTTPLNKLNLDFVFIDTEHSPHNLQDVSRLCHQFGAMGIEPVVRISDPDPYKASIALDAGATGIIAPYIETPEEVRDLVGAVKYKPLKGRKLRDFLDGKTTLEDKLLAYLRKANDNHLLFANIESVPAMENLTDILGIEDLDGVIVGPHDMSCSLGIPEEYDNPLFIDTIDNIVEKACEYGKAVGYHKGYSDDDAGQMVAWARRGMNIIIHEADVLSAPFKLGTDIDRMRSALGDIARSEGDTRAI